MRQPTSFTLEVVFTGLCMHLRHPDLKNPRVGVVLPDARLRKVKLRGRAEEDEVVAADGEVLVPHVGYLRYNLADTGVKVPSSHPGDKDAPDFEVIHRFDREELVFGVGPDTPPGEIVTQLPELERFAPTAKPINGLFSDTPPAEVL